MQDKFENIITESKSYSTKKKVEEAYDPSIPDWLKSNGKGSTMQDFKNKIDLSNAKYVPLNKDEFTNTDPIWKDNDYIKIFNTPKGVYATDGKIDYISDYGDTYYDDNYRTRRLSKTSRKNLIDMSTDIGYIKKSDVEVSDSNARKYGRYEDPRTGVSHGYYGGYNKDEYAGQYQDDEGNWHTQSGRDKSGYEIPKPEEMLAKYYNVDGIEDVQRVLDTYYKKLTDIRDEITSLDFRKFTSDSFQGSYLYEALRRAINDYMRYAEECESMIKRIAKQGVPEYYDSFADYFNNETSYYKKELSDDILYLRDVLKKTQENMNESKLVESEQQELPKINDLSVQFFNEVIKDDRGDAYAYEFIANHYWEMDKDTLKTILLEYIYRAEGEQDRYDMLQELYEGLYIKDIIEEECPECLDAYLNIYKEYVDID